MDLMVPQIMYPFVLILIVVYAGDEALLNIRIPDLQYRNNNSGGRMEQYLVRGEMPQLLLHHRY